MKKKLNTPKKGAARKWSQRLKELGEQPPPPELIAKLNAHGKDFSLLKRTRRRLQWRLDQARDFLCRHICKCHYYGSDE